jgi:UDP-glucose 4-epimerase
VRTIILRPCNVVGPHLSNAMSRFLRLRTVPYLVGFSPMMQFIHEEDLAEAISLALETGARGVFNVVGPGAVPLKVAIRETGGTAVPLLETVAREAVTRLFSYGLYPFPADAIDFAKYPCTIDGRRFRDATGFKPLFTLEETLRSVRR